MMVVKNKAFTLIELLAVIVILAIIAFCCILIPENIIKKKDHDFYFKSNGYYDRFEK